MALIAAAAWLAAVLLTGAATLRILGSPLRPARAFGLGVAVSSLLLNAWLLAGLPMAFPLPLLAPALATMWARRKSWWPPGEEPALPKLLLLPALIVFFFATQGPEASLDGRSQWGLAARFLWYGGPQPDQVSPNPGYPMLVPLQDWSLYAWRGAPDDRLTTIFSPLCWLAFLGLLWTPLSRSLPPRRAQACLLVVAFLPFLAFHRDGGAISGYADVALTMLFTGTLLAALRQDWREAAVWGASVLITKREGQALLLVGLVLAWLFYRPAHRRAVAIFLAVGLVQFSQIGIFWARAQPELFLCFGPGNLLAMSRQMFAQPFAWNFFWWAVVLSLPGRPWTREDRFLAAFLAAYLVVLGGVYLPLSPKVWDWNTFNRTLLPLVPVGTLLVSRALRPEPPR